MSRGKISIRAVVGGRRSMIGIEDNIRKNIIRGDDYNLIIIINNNNNYQLILFFLFKIKKTKNFTNQQKEIYQI